MDGILNNIRRELRPSDIVIPLSEVMEKLESKLTPEEMDAFLQAIVAGRRAEVRPGELITADLMNQILVGINDLRIRVAKLEGMKEPAEGQVKINRIIPSGKLNVGEEIVIEGENFEFSIGGSRVLFGTKSIFKYNPGSRDDRLIVDVPDPGGLPEAGAQVLLTVSNRSSSDYRVVTVVPAKIPLYGSVLVTPAGDVVEPNPPEANKEAFFTYKLTSAASREAEFPITVFLGETGGPLDSILYKHLISVLGPNGDPLPTKKITLAPGTLVYIKVRVSQLPFPDQTSFDMMVSLSTEGVQGDSMIKTYTVGQKIEDDDFINLDLVNYDPNEWVQEGTATIPVNKVLSAVMILKLSEKAVNANVTSAVCDITLDLTNGSGWSLLLLEPTPAPGSPNKGDITLTVGGDDGKTPVPSNLRFAIGARPNPSASARLELVVTRQGQTGDIKSKKEVLILSLPSG